MMAEIQDPVQHEKEISRRTKAANPKEIDLCERFLGHLNEGFNRLPRPYTRVEPFDHVLRLGTLGYNSLRWAFELLLKGYYTQANALSRLAWECWLHGVYLILYPDQLEEWREFKTRPRPWNMRKLVTEGMERLSREPESIDWQAHRADLDRMYFSYSEYSHPTDIALRVLFEDRNGELWLRLGGAFDDVLILQSTDMFCYATEMLFTLLYVLLPEDADYSDGGTVLREELNAWRKEWIEKASESQPKGYGPESES